MGSRPDAAVSGQGTRETHRRTLFFLFQIITLSVPMATPLKAKTSNRYIYAVTLAGAAIVIGVFLFCRKSAPAPPSTPGASTFHPAPEMPDNSAFALYGNSESCKGCHEREYRLWHGSHHGLAERLIEPAIDAIAF